jgi:hypothetical protein
MTQGSVDKEDGEANLNSRLCTQKTKAKEQQGQEKVQQREVTQ